MPDTRADLPGRCVPLSSSLVYDRESSTSQSKVQERSHEQEVLHVGEVPLMTDKASFVINGTERTSRS
jgi:DNA-directed RNA polymerase beta subunit